MPPSPRKDLMKELLSELKASGFSESRDALEAGLEKNPEAAQKISKHMQKHIVAHASGGGSSKIATSGIPSSSDTDLTNPPTICTYSNAIGIPTDTKLSPSKYGCKSCGNMICKRKWACDRYVREAEESKSQSTEQGFFLKPFTRYLFKYAVGIRTGELIEKRINSGVYWIRKVFCTNCNSEIGFKYRIAPSAEHEWKVGKVALYGNKLQYAGY